MTLLVRVRDLVGGMKLEECFTSSGELHSITGRQSAIGGHREVAWRELRANLAS